MGRHRTSPFGIVTAAEGHAHVFKRDLPPRPYAPDYDATLEEYIKVLDANGVPHAVLHRSVPLHP